MNRLLALMCAAMTLLAITPHATAATTYSGSFLVGEPVGYLVLDACGWPEMEGLNSNCVTLALDSVGAGFTLVATDSLGTLIDADVCFYSDDAFLNCDEFVPEGATRAAVFSLGGYQVSWTLTIG